MLLSLVSLLAVIGIIFLLFPGDGGKEVLDKDVFQAVKAIERFDASTQDWRVLNDRLSVYGYKLLVLKENKVVFSTLSDPQGWSINSLKSLEPEQSVLAGKAQEMTFAAAHEGLFKIFAVKGMINNLTVSNDFLRGLLIICLIAIAFILLLSQLFTRQMAWRILHPLNALSDGAKRIENGDLSIPVVYTGKDEFASVCTAFNHMQKHLRQEREKTAAYERARTDLISGISQPQNPADLCPRLHQRFA